MTSAIALPMELKLKLCRMDGRGLAFVVPVAFDLVEELLRGAEGERVCPAVTVASAMVRMIQRGWFQQIAVPRRKWRVGNTGKEGMQVGGS
jgi:hypothetical protein